MNARFKTTHNFFFLLLFVGLLSFASSKSQPTNKGTLYVHISNVESSTGTIRVNVFKKGDDIFEKPFLIKLIEPNIDGLEVAFKELTYSDYVVYVFQDENNNKKMDHSFGLPAEPFGYSNNWELTIFSGKPSFKKTKFTFSKKNNIVNIKLN